MPKETVDTEKVFSPPNFPFANAVKSGNMLFISGQLSVNHKGEIVGIGDIVSQTKQVLHNIKEIIEEANGSLTDIVKTTVFIRDIKYIEGMNKAYSDFFSSDFPARTTVKADLLLKDCLIEIDAIACLPSFEE